MCVGRFCKIERFIYIICLLIVITLYLYTQSPKCRSFKECISLFESNDHVSSKRSDGAPFLVPNKTILKSLGENQLLEIYWKYINTLQVLCRKQRRLGSLKDGGKEVCVDELYEPRQPCLVYSFGSSFNFDFEVDVIRIYNCEVHTIRGKYKISYDKKIKEHVKADSQASKPIDGRTIPRGINFHLIGLGTHSHINELGWRMETLASVRKQLNHTDRYLDILKIDIDGGEWVALLQILQSGVLKYVKQICLEVHFGKRFIIPLKEQLGALKKLHEQGFSIFMREHNVVMIRALSRMYPFITTINEISLINTNFKNT